MTDRLPHCTPTLGGHAPLCDHDGRYCSLVSSHDGPCAPHGSWLDPIVEEQRAIQARQGITPELLAAATEADETIDPDELERFAEQRRDEAVMRREQRRADDLDDGVVWPDDH